MTDEATLLALIAERPDDAVARLVYADWLETQGDERRATVVRLHDQLATHAATVALADPALLEYGRALIGLAHKLSHSWLAVIAPPTLVGTVWGTRDEGNRAYLLGFGPDGVLTYWQEGGGQSPGWWLQIGAAVVIEINRYSSREGVMIDDRMRGVAGNDANNTWSWGLRRIDDPTAIDRLDMPELPPEPRDTALEVNVERAAALRAHRRL